MRRLMRWAIEWHSHNRLDGEQRYFLGEGEGPLLFLTRAEARRYIRQRYGYISGRADLRAEPHGWRLPQAVRVQVVIQKVQG